MALRVKKNLAPTDEIDYEDVELRVSGNISGAHSWLEVDDENYEPLTCVAVRKSTGFPLDPQPPVFWSKVKGLGFYSAACQCTVGLCHLMAYG